MRIGVDATCWPSRRGYGRFVRALITATLSSDRENEYVLFVDSEPEEFPLPEHLAEVVRVSCRQPATKAAAADGRRALRDVWALSRAISAKKLDLFFFPSVYSFVPIGSRVPIIVTVHDAIAELHPELIFPTLRSKLFWRAKVKLACAQARLILTVSEYAKRCVTEQLGIALSRLRVVNEASDPVFRQFDLETGGLPIGRLGQISPKARYLVYVGGFSPHKNLTMLVNVFQQLQSQPQFADLRLLLVGDYEKDVFYSCYTQVLEQVKQAGLQERVLFPGYLADQDLARILNGAQALVLPSFSEGFGLPAIEAAACGAPTVVTTKSPLPELLGEGTIGVDPKDRAALLNALQTILSDPPRREAMRRAALAAAARLSWENSARQLLAIFHEVLETCGAPA